MGSEFCFSTRDRIRRHRQQTDSTTSLLVQPDTEFFLFSILFYSIHVCGDKLFSPPLIHLVNLREYLEPQQPWEENIVPILQMKPRLKEVKLGSKDRYPNKINS